MPRSFAKKPPRRVYYLAGPGDVIGTFRRWLADRDRTDAAPGDEREIATTYSGQFFDLVARHGLTALVEAARQPDPDTPTGLCAHSAPPPPRAGEVPREAQRAGRRGDEGATTHDMSPHAPPHEPHAGPNDHAAHQPTWSIRVYARPPIGRRWRGPFFDLGMALNACRILTTALRFNADTLVIASGTRWFMLIPAAILGIRVVPCLHNTLWPAGVVRRRGLVTRMVDRLNALFWRRFASGTVAISPTVRSQVLEAARVPEPRLRGPVLVATPQYDPRRFDAIAPPVHASRPFTVLFAGRLERDKGVFDILDAAQIVEQQAPGQVRWELAGDGGARAELERAIASSPLRDRFIILGHQNHTDMRAAFERSHVVIVPTRSTFAEGFNKVVGEGVIFGRPIITSPVVPAADVVGGAVVVVPPDKPEGYADAILRLLREPVHYERLRAATDHFRPIFFDPSRSWGAMLERALGLVPEPRD